jgi:5-methylcytosine-specific restriction endonuclease McrA
MTQATRKSKDVNWKEVQSYYDEGNSSRATAEAFSLTRGQWDAAVERGDLMCRPLRLLSDEDVFTVGSIVSGAWLKKRLLRAGLLGAKCSITECGLSTWLGRPIALHLDHINGDRRDNRVENLRLLCPNCHSQTDTYAGRNIKKPYRRRAPKKFYLTLKSD